MVKKFFSFLNREVEGLHRAAYVLAVFALLSQFLGLVRDKLLAHFFGASTTLDVYYTAFRIPDALFASVASVVSIFVLVPFLIDRLEGEGGEAGRFLSDVFSVFFVFIVGVAVAFFFLMPYLSRTLFPGFEGQALSDLVLLSRIMLLSPILLGLSNLFASITQIYKKFLVYSLAPLFYNIGIILGIVVFYPRMGITGLGIGVVLGALLNLSIHVPVVIEKGFWPSIRLRIRWGEIKRVVMVSLPRTLTLSVNSIALLALVATATTLSEGSVSIFNLSFNLQSAPLGIIGASYSVAAFPTLARYFSAGDRLKFARQIVMAARHIIFWSIPAIFLFIVLRAQIVRVIFGSGEFGWPETRLTAAALAVFSVSLLAQGLIMLFVRGYYAAGFTRKPLIINALSGVLIIVLAFVLTDIYRTSETLRFFVEEILRIGGIEGTIVVMLPLAYSIGTIINAALLWFWFNRDFEEFSISIKESFYDSMVSSFLMGLVAFRLLSLFDNVFDINTFWGIFFQGFLSGIIAIAVGAATLWFLGNKEIREISQTLRSRISRDRSVAADREGL